MSVLKSGTIYKDEEWSGNIVITDDIVIPKKVQILVKPDTKIKFLKKSKNILFNKKIKLNYLIKKFNLSQEQYKNKISISVYGSFIVEGTKEQPVTIGNDGWDGIIYAANDSQVKFINTEIRYGFGIICDVNSKLPIIDSCILEQCCLAIVSFSKIIIKNSRINFNEIGIICYNKSLICNNTIVDNFSNGIFVFSAYGYCNKNYVSLNGIGIEASNSQNFYIYQNKVYININGIILKKSNNIHIDGFIAYNINSNIVIKHFCFDVYIESKIF